MVLGLPNVKLIVFAIVVVFAVMLGVLGYVALTLRGSGALPAPAPLAHVLPTVLSASLTGQNLLAYNNNQSYIPYATFSYLSSNSSTITINATLLRSPPPSSVYLLEPYPTCVGCNYAGLVAGSLGKYLYRYGVIANPSYLTNVSQANITSMPRDSVLIMLNGLMPQYMFNDVSGTNTTLIQYLLNQGDSIVYVGQNFTSVLLDTGVVVPNTRAPLYLLTGPAQPQSGSGFYFDNATYSLAEGATYGPLTYVNVANGSIVAFPNYLSSWPNATDASIDIARAVSMMFWLPAYAKGSSSIVLNQYANTTGSVGVLMNEPTIPYSSAALSRLDRGTLRAVVYNGANYSLSGRSRYIVLTGTPSYSSNGSLSMPESVIPGRAASLVLEVDTHSSIPVSIQPHISVRSLNMSRVAEIPLQYFNAAGNFTFLKSVPFDIPPGEYIAELRGFSGYLYASTLFNVSPVTIMLQSANYSSNRFSFLLQSSGLPLSGISYTISVNGLYTVSGTIDHGVINYTLPKGSPALYGNLAFNISMLSTTFTYTAKHPAPTIVINQQYVVLGIVGMIVLALVTLVRAPNRDEFYIDVPHLPKREATPVKIRAAELVSIFDKMNIYYHWRYMPLNKAELRVGVANNIRFNGMPVNLTYNNLDILLDQLVVHGDVVTTGELYAPKSWITQSGYDLEYLATFKKLRLYMVTHAYVFTDIGSSPVADMVVALHGERAYVVIYSPTSKFKKMPVYKNSKTYLVFLNGDRLDEFRERLYGSPNESNEILKMYVSSGMVTLVDADHPEAIE